MLKILGATVILLTLALLLNGCSRPGGGFCLWFPKECQEPPR